MAGYLPSQEILKILLERIELLERVLGENTRRLHSIEQHLGIVRQPLPEPLAGERGETHPATSQIKTEDLKASEPTQPPIQPPIHPTPVAPPPPEPPVHTWSKAETPETRDTHPWMNEPSAPRTYATREATAPYGLDLLVKKPAPANEAGRAGTVREPKRREDGCRDCRG